MASLSAGRSLVASFWLLIAAACADGPDERPATWPYIHATIVRPACATAGCHSELTSNAELELEDREEALFNLVDIGVIIAGEPDESELMRLLRGDDDVRMPPDEPLPPADIELVERWILDGAAAR